MKKTAIVVALLFMVVLTKTSQLPSKDEKDEGTILKKFNALQGGSPILIRGTPISVTGNMKNMVLKGKNLSLGYKQDGIQKNSINQKGSENTWKENKAEVNTEPLLSI